MIFRYGFPFQSTAAAAAAAAPPPLDEPSRAHASDCWPDVPGTSDRQTSLFFILCRY